MTVPRKRRAYAARMPVEQRREQLLDAALRLVVSAGHGAVTMAAVAEEAGVTKPVVYGVFGHLGDLLAALLGREQEAALAQLRPILVEEADPVTAMAAFLEAVREAPNRWHCIVMPLPDMPADFHAARETARAEVVRLAEAVARRALGDHPDPELVALAWVSVCETAARLTLTDPDTYPAARFEAAFRAALPT